MNTPGEIREWALEQAARRHPFTGAELRQAALLARELDARDDTAA